MKQGAVKPLGPCVEEGLAAVREVAWLDALRSAGSPTLGGPTGRTSCRCVRFQAGDAYDFSGAPVQVLFGGNARYGPLASGATLLSDEVTLAVSGTSNSYQRLECCCQLGAVVLTLLATVTCSRSCRLGITSETKRRRSMRQRPTRPTAPIKAPRWKCSVERPSASRDAIQTQS